MKHSSRRRLGLWSSCLVVGMIMVVPVRLHAQGSATAVADTAASAPPVDSLPKAEACAKTKIADSIYASLEQAGAVKMVTVNGRTGSSIVETDSATRAASAQFKALWDEAMKGRKRLQCGNRSSTRP